VIHRDIKPENILLHDGRPMVMDFGIALAVSAAAGGRMTETGLSLGTPHYMSPEQATADKTITARSDVYSLASVLYEMLAGEPPHTGGSAQAIIMKIIAEPVADVTVHRKAVPANVAAALSKALEKLPADRFESAKAFAEALGNSGFGRGEPTGIAGRAEQAGPWNRLSIGFASLAAVLALILAWSLLRPRAPLPVIRHTFAVPAAFARGNAAPGMALAPDGSWLVFVGPGSGPEGPQLWVKARDRIEATPLGGTTRASAPAVSPDGKWIAFSTPDRQLRKIPAGGGPTTTIADSVGFAVWVGDGDLAYADVEGRMRRVPGQGGAPEVVYTPESGWLAQPVASLPDGRGILFLNCSPVCQVASDLWALDTRSGKATELIPDVGNAVYAAGRLIFVRRDGGVFAASFDPRGLKLVGEPVPLFEGVRVRALADFALSRSGTLAYVPVASATESEFVWVSRDGQAKVVDSSWTETSGANGSLSPDGTRLAFQQGGDIWIKQLDRGALSRLTLGPGSKYRPNWTPDGRAVTFLVNEDTVVNAIHLRRAEWDADSVVNLPLDPPANEALWSPDGQWLIVRVGLRPGQKDVVALKVGESKPRPLLTGPYDEVHPIVSPDGRWLAYVSNETGRQEVFVRPFPDVASGKWPVSTAGGESPLWAHSGRELFFVNANREVVSQAVTAGSEGAFRLGEQRVLFRLERWNFSGNVRELNISPDDRRFLMSRRKEGAIAERRDLVLVENWLQEVNRAMKSGSR